MLYNVYRPDSLDKIIEQDIVVKALKKRFKERSLPHTIFLNGETGRGKTTLARIIAKHLACNHLDENGYSCNICDICKAIDEEKQNNFFFELNASNLGINEIRELIKDSEIKTFSQSKNKIFLIDELQEMSKTPAALKNLLKPLEKELKNVYFILGAMSDINIPSSLKDRSISYKLKSLSVEGIVKQLSNICEQENIKIDTEEKANVLITIAENSYGSMRSAISYLERIIDSDLWIVNQCIKELDIISNNDLIQSINYLFEGNTKAFEIQYTKELFEKIRSMLSIIYKLLNDIVLPYWQTKQLSGINKSIKKEQVEFALKEIFELNKFPYLTQELIDFTLIKILEENKKYKSVPKRRGE
jgi:DNA polymerase III subunit gamma/tau